VRVDTEKQRTIDALLRAVLADGLRDGEDMPLVEAVFELGTSVSRRAERNAVRWD
jgi:hypothetical protein